MRVLCCHKTTMRVLLNFFCVSFFTLSGVFPSTALTATGASPHASMKIHITHSHEHAHDDHHHSEHQHESQLGEASHLEHPNVQGHSPTDKHHSEKHSHEHFVSCSHPYGLVETPKFETTPVEPSNSPSFEFKQSVPPNRALGSIFRPPILA